MPIVSLLILEDFNIRQKKKSGLSSINVASKFLWVYL